MTASAALPRRPQSSARTGESRVTSRTITTLPALERELQEGLLHAWKQLVDADPLASCFQTPGWCMPWYRSYHDEFDPFVVLVSDGGSLVGLVPLAVRRASGEILFASGTMADYRDIVAQPGARAAVTTELLRVYHQGRFPNPLQIGWIDPASDTPQLVADACRSLGLPFTAWQQPCYRWFPVEGENLSKKFSRVRTHLNHFKRMGNVTFDVITDGDEWTAFRDAFFQQHSLRQLQADRTTSFDDPRKQRFYDRLFDTSTFQTHVAALRIDGQLLSGHIGIAWRDVLMLGAPSISLEHEQRSPALVLISWIIQNADSLGFKGFDLTVGDTDFKKRLGNQCVNVTMIEVYGRKHTYYAKALRSRGVAVAKRAVARLSGEGAWKTRVKPALDAAARHVAVARQDGMAAAVRTALGRPVQGIPREPLIITSESVHSLEATSAETPAWQSHENRVEDLLLDTGAAATTARAVRGCARDYSRQRAAGATFHSLTVGDALAAWCFSLGSAETGEAAVTSLFTVPEWRARGAEAALLARVAHSALAAGATRVVVSRD